MKYLLQPPVVAALYLRVYLLDHSLQSRGEGANATSGQCANLSQRHI